MSLSITQTKYKFLAVALSVALVVCSVLHPMQARAASIDDSLPTVTYVETTQTPAQVKAYLDALVLPSLTLVLGIIGFIAITYCVCRNVDIGIDYSGQSFFDKCQTVGQYMYQQLAAAAEGAVDQSKQALAVLFWSVMASVAVQNSPTPSDDPEPSPTADPSPTPEIGTWGSSMNKFNLLHLADFFGALSLYFNSSFMGDNATSDAAGLLETVAYETPDPEPANPSASHSTFAFFKGMSKYSYPIEFSDFWSDLSMTFDFKDCISYMNWGQYTDLNGNRQNYASFRNFRIRFNDLPDSAYNYIAIIVMYYSNYGDRYALQLYHYYDSAIHRVNIPYSEYCTDVVNQVVNGIIYKYPGSYHVWNSSPSSTISNYIELIADPTYITLPLTGSYETFGGYLDPNYLLQYLSRHFANVGIKVLGSNQGPNTSLSNWNGVRWYYPVEPYVPVTHNYDYVTYPTDDIVVDIPNVQEVLDPESELDPVQAAQRERVEDQLEQGSTKGMQDLLLNQEPDSPAQVDSAYQSETVSGPDPDPSAPLNGLNIPSLDNIWKYVRYTFNTLGSFITYCGQCLDAVTVGEGGLSWFYYGAFIMFICGGFISKLLL